jgi:hypothetical protein
MAKRHRYVGVVEDGAAMFLRSRPGENPIQSTVCAAVMFTGDKRIVQRATRYRKGEEPRNLQATATRMAGKWNGYFERTGKRWELEQDKKRQAKMAKRKAEDQKRIAIRNAAPALLAMLERFVRAQRFGDPLPLEEADAMIAELK